MRQTVALFMILLFSFNLVGYRWLLDYVQMNTVSEMQLQLDEGKYEDAQLLELKVPINMPYQSNWSSYQRCYGIIKIDGHTYQYVKRKVSNDTLYLMCIRDVKTQQVEIAKNELFQLANDLNLENQSHNTSKAMNSFLKNHSIDYDDFIALPKIRLMVSLQNLVSIDKSIFYPSFPSQSPEQPPDFPLA